MSVTEAEYFSKLRDQQESERAVAQGSILQVILDPDRHIAAGETEVWRASYSAKQLTGSDGKPVNVSASIHRNSDDALLFHLVTAGNFFHMPGLWSPFDALVWFGLDQDDPVWKRDPGHERLYKAAERRAAEEAEAQAQRIIVPGRKPLVRMQQD